MCGCFSKIIKIIFVGLEDEPLKLSIEASPEPPTEENRQDAIDQLYSRLNTNDGRRDLSQYLSNGLDSKISVDKVYKGSIILDLKVKTYSALHEIKYLSDQGVLSNMLNCFLITPEYKAACQAEKVLLTAKVDERSYLALVEYAQSIPSYINISVVTDVYLIIITIQILYYVNNCNQPNIDRTWANGYTASTERKFDHISERRYPVVLY